MIALLVKKKKDCISRRTVLQVQIAGNADQVFGILAIGQPGSCRFLISEHEGQRGQTVNRRSEVSVKLLGLVKDIRIGRIQSVSPVEEIINFAFSEAKQAFGDLLGFRGQTVRALGKLLRQAGNLEQKAAFFNLAYISVNKTDGVSQKGIQLPLTDQEVGNP